MTKKFKLYDEDHPCLHVQSFLKATRRSKDLSHWMREDLFQCKVVSIYKSFERYPSLRKITLLVDYPFGDFCGHPTHSSAMKINRHTSVADVVIEFARFYSELYQTPAKSQVFGHSIGDLSFDDITFYKDGTVRVEVSS